RPSRGGAPRAPRPWAQPRAGGTGSPAPAPSARRGEPKRGAAAQNGSGRGRGARRRAAPALAGRREGRAGRGAAGALRRSSAAPAPVHKCRECSTDLHIFPNIRDRRGSKKRRSWKENERGKPAPHQGWFHAAASEPGVPTFARVCGGVRRAVWGRPRTAPGG
ncbi:hypothetical protein HGM15179_011029, partial [Zosterops borbonicus]